VSTFSKETRINPLLSAACITPSKCLRFGMPGGRDGKRIKSNSTKGGGGYNEMSMNDTKGKELITIHGQLRHGYHCVARPKNACHPIINRKTLASISRAA
jgi:hypothetical protein